MAALNDTNIISLGLQDRLLHTWNAFLDNRAKARVYHQTYRELSALSAKDLADIGLNRSMISSVAHEAAYGHS